VRWFSSSSKKPEAVVLLLVPGEVYERGKMLHNNTGLVPDRADEDGGPEHAAVFAPKTNFKIDFSFACERDLDLRQRLRIGRTRHQEVEALAEHLLAIVSPRAIDSCEHCLCRPMGQKSLGLSIDTSCAAAGCARKRRVEAGSRRRLPYQGWFVKGARRRQRIPSGAFSLCPISNRRPDSQIGHQSHKAFVLMILMMTVEQRGALIVRGEINLDGAESRRIDRIFHHACGGLFAHLGDLEAVAMDVDGVVITAFVGHRQAIVLSRFHCEQRVGIRP
jgi:hypothetical protein